MAKRHGAALACGTLAGLAFVTVYSIKNHDLGGIDQAVPQALASFTLVLNLGLLKDLWRFAPEDMGKIGNSRNTLLGAVFIICILSPWYILKSFHTLISS